METNVYRLFVFFLVIAAALSTGTGKVFENLKHIKPQASPANQTAAVRGLLKRLLPTRYENFHVEVIPINLGDDLDSFVISSDGTHVNVTGSTGVAAAFGLQHYLVHYCNCHISWHGNQLYLPPDGQLPVIKPRLEIRIPNRYRYYQNVCTVSYTFAFWDWTRWERHIDWMALNGINLPLAFNGQEAMWQKVYLKMGLTQDQLDQHFGGPAFLAWARMGNIDGWGGPLPQSWHAQQLALQHQILIRMRSLGMIPVLPAFAGHVPEAFASHFPNASISHLDNWGHFEPEYCCTALLDPQDPLFQEVGKAFIEALAEEFNGTDHIYNADTFNEMTPKSKDPAYLSAASRGVYDAIIAGDPKGVWLMQGWLFQDTSFWGPSEIKALLHGVPIGSMIVLDLFAERHPIYSATKSFYGQPFIWCMLHNFGGTSGLYGNPNAINEGPFKAATFPNSTMVGMGMTPEGIFQNYIMYNLLTDMSWRSKPTNVSQWIMQYSERRYSKQSSWSQDATKAWAILLDTVYNDVLEVHQKTVPVQRPAKHISDTIWYDFTKVAEAWELLLQASPQLNGSSLFRYDLVDVTRNVLQDLSFDFYEDLMRSFDRKDDVAVKGNGTLLCNLILDMDKITSSHQDWLLGTWLEDAKSLASTESEKSLYEYNARNQLTLWGPNGQIVDYANKQWGGLLRTYYHTRWQLYTTYLLECLKNNQTYDQDFFNTRSFLSESNWTFGSEIFPTKPVGDTVEISQHLYTKYQPYIKDARVSGKAKIRKQTAKTRNNLPNRGAFSYHSN